MRWRRSEFIEAAEHKRTLDEIGDFSLAPTRLEIFTAIALVVLAVALLVIWGPDAAQALFREIVR